MDKFVVKSKQPADVEDSNSKNEAKKKTKYIYASIRLSKVHGQ